MLDKIFKLKENKTKVSTEVIAGITTFMAMSYIIFLNPAVLSQTGMEYSSVYAATILASIIGTLIVGLVANVPYGQSAGIGLGSLFTYTICGIMGYTWNQALAMVFICGTINAIITFTSVRKLIVKAIPNFLQEAITVGIGLFIAYIGFMNAGLISFGADAIVDGFATGVTPQLSSFNTYSVILAIIGLIITIILVVKKVKGAYLIGIILTTLIGIPMGVTKLPNFGNYVLFPSIAPTFFKLDFVGLFSVKSQIIMVLMTIFTLCISDLFDTIGIFIGTGKKAGIFTLDKDGNMPKKLEKAMFADSIGTIFGSLLGSSNITTYLESSAGIEAGGRTGLTSVVIAICFFLSLFISPIIECVPIAAIAPVLILIGLSMLENISSIDWKDYLIAIPSFFIVVLMPFSYSITTGIEVGFIIYTLVNLVTGNAKKVSPIIYIFSILFILNFIFLTI